PLFVKSSTRVIVDGLIFLQKVTTSPQPQWGILTIVNGSHDITIEGNGVLDGNRATQTPNICCIGGIVSGGPGLRCYTGDARNIKVRGLTIKNMPQWPISLDGATDVTIDSVTASDSTNSFQIGHGTTNASVSNVHISNIDDVGFAFYRGVHSASIAN